MKNISEFYKWASENYTDNLGRIHPINWLHMARYSKLLKDHIKKSEIKPFILAVKPFLVRKQYEYIVFPDFLIKIREKYNIKNNKIHLKGNISFKNNEYYISCFNEKIPLKNTWVIKEINL